jgi:hypothetical protein
MSDVFKDAQIAQFRSVQFPIASWEATFSHDTVEHGLQYRDNKLIEITGGKNLTFNYTIPFRADIAKGPYPNLFRVSFPLFWQVFQDKSRGELVDPIFGVRQGVPGQITFTADPNRRDGIDAQVSFIEQPDLAEEGEVDTVPTPASVTSDARRLDDEVEAIDWEQEEPPEATADPLSAIAGAGAQINQSAGRVAAQLHNTAARCEKVEDQAEELEDPETTAQVIRGARRVNVSSRRLADRAQNPGRTIRKIETNAWRSHTELAREFGMTVEELLDINPDLALTPSVPPGTEVNRYADDRNAAGPSETDRQQQQ